MRHIGAILILSSLTIGVGYLFYCAFGAFYNVVPIPIKIATIAIGIGLIVLLASIVRQRLALSRVDDLNEADD